MTELSPPLNKRFVAIGDQSTLPAVMIGHLLYFLCGFHMFELMSHSHTVLTVTIDHYSICAQSAVDDITLCACFTVFDCLFLVQYISIPLCDTMFAYSHCISVSALFFAYSRCINMSALFFSYSLH